MDFPLAFDNRFTGRAKTIVNSLRKLVAIGERRIGPRRTLPVHIPQTVEELKAAPADSPRRNIRKLHTVILDLPCCCRWAEIPLLPYNFAKSCRTAVRRSARKLHYADGCSPLLIFRPVFLPSSHLLVRGGCLFAGPGPLQSGAGRDGKILAGNTKQFPFYIHQLNAMPGETSGLSGISCRFWSIFAMDVSMPEITRNKWSLPNQSASRKL